MDGTVADFDAHVGLGTIVAQDGRKFSFHCTQIADDSREVTPGQHVRFDVVPGHSGRWEATRIEKGL